MGFTIMLKYGVVAAALAAQYGVNAEETIGQILQKLATTEKSWSSGPNVKFPVDKKPSDFKHLFGSLEIPKHLDLAEKWSLPKPLSAVPDSFDPRVGWPNCPSISEIRDQSACGSCWAFGAASAFSDRLCIHSDAAITESYSTDDMLSCCKTCGFGCGGGYTSQAWNFLVTHGVCTGGLYEGTGCKPYSFPPCEHHAEGDRTDCSEWDFDTPRCTSECVGGYELAGYEADKKTNANAYKVPRRVEEIQKELMTNGPAEASFTVYDDFMSYTGGVYHHVSGKSLGGHAVKIMGWGVDAVGGDYWLIANSWNNDWAEDGYFRIRRGTNECGIEGGIYAGMP